MTEAFICEGLRTPIGRFGGAMATIRPDDMLAQVMRQVVALAPSLDVGAIDDAVIGCANQAGEDNRDVARMAVLLAGLPDTIGGVTVNRLCGSGLDSISMAARAIKTGEADIILAGGVESMSRAPFVMGKAETAFSRKAEIYDTTLGWRFVNRLMKAQFGTDTMPETAENVAADFNISRSDQDLFALRSQQKAASAIASGRLAQEITPMTIPVRRGDDIVFAADEHPRPSTLEKLGKLATPFRKNGSITAGNASGLNDGAAVVIVASAAAVEKYGLKPKARIVMGAVAGVPPRIMGIGPVPAVNKLLERTGLKVSDVDLFELNEAFAAQGLAVMRQLGIADDADFVNPNGGAIALGHPLGMSGTRMALSAAIEMQNTGMNRAVCTMCIGVGQGIALMLERV